MALTAPVLGAMPAQGFLSLEQKQRLQKFLKAERCLRQAVPTF